MTPQFRSDSLKVTCHHYHCSWAA